MSDHCNHGDEFSRLFELLAQYHGELKHIRKQLDHLIEKVNIMSQEVDALNAKLDAQDAAIADVNTALGTLTTSVATEIQQLKDAIAAGGSAAEFKTAVVGATARLDTANQGLVAAKAGLQSAIDSLASDDTPPAP